MHIHDTVIRTVWQTDSSQIIALRRELERVRGMLSDTVRAETSFAVAQAWADGGTLLLELRNKDSARVEVPVYHEREESRHEEARTKETVKVVTEFRTRPLVAAAAWLGLVSVLVWLGKGILRLIMRLK